MRIEKRSGAGSKQIKHLLQEIQFTASCKNCFSKYKFDIFHNKVKWNDQLDQELSRQFLAVLLGKYQDEKQSFFRKISKRKGRKKWTEKHQLILKGALMLFGENLQVIQMILPEFNIGFVQNKLIHLNWRKYLKDGNQEQTIQENPFKNESIHLKNHNELTNDKDQVPQIFQNRYDTPVQMKQKKVCSFWNSNDTINRTVKDLSPLSQKDFKKHLLSTPSSISNGLYEFNQNFLASPFSKRSIKDGGFSNSISPLIFSQQKKQCLFQNNDFNVIMRGNNLQVIYLLFNINHLFLILIMFKRKVLLFSRYKLIHKSLDFVEQTETKLMQINYRRFFKVGIFSGIGFYTFWKVQEYKEYYTKNFTEENVQIYLNDVIKMAIINHVFHNLPLMVQLNEKINQFSSKDFTLILVSKLLEDLLRSKIIFKESFQLTKKKLLLDIVFTDIEIERKLTNILSNQIKSEKIRSLVKELLYSYFRSPNGINTVIEGMNQGISSQEVKDQFANESKTFLHDMLDNTINSKVIAEKLKTLFGK